MANPTTIYYAVTTESGEEDDPIVLRGCRRALQLAGLAVEAVASAEEAWRSIETERPGVVGVRPITACRLLDDKPPIPVYPPQFHRPTLSLSEQLFRILSG